MCTSLNVLLRSIFKIIILFLCTYYLGWMSCLISFKRCQSSCEEHKTSELYKNTLFIVRFEPLHGKETSLKVHRLNRSANSQLLWIKRKRKRSDSVLWQKPLHRQKNPKSNMTTQNRHQTKIKCPSTAYKYI